MEPTDLIPGTDITVGQMQEWIHDAVEYYEPSPPFTDEEFGAMVARDFTRREAIRKYVEGKMRERSA